MKRRGFFNTALASLAIPVIVLASSSISTAEVLCSRTITVDVAAIDTALVFNRLGAQNVNAMVYALRRDVINVDSDLTLNNGGAAVPGRLALRPDKRPRPITIRAAEGDCLTVNFSNLLTPVANPFDPVAPGVQGQNPDLLPVDEQTAGRFAGIHFQGLELLNGIADDSSYVGENPNSLVPAGGSATYRVYAARQGTFPISSYGATFGSEGLQGSNAGGLFGVVTVEPRGAKFYRSQVTEEEMRLTTVGATGDGHPTLDYEKTYPNSEPWISEGKAGLPVLNMLTAGNELVHTDINAIVTGPGGAANPFFSASAYPLESAGKRNPTVPNRLQPFREFTVVFHDEVATQQAFPFWYTAPGGDTALLPWKYLLEGVKDGFMINYGSGGIGSEIIANRLGVGPMHDCLGCNYEEFFLTSFTVADPAMVVDVPANTGLESCRPDTGAGCADVGPKASFAFYPEDPANIHHSYMNDAVRFRNVHVGSEQHIFHLHNHQWLFSANDDDANYLDAQGVGPGSGYTYEINFGGSGNRNKSAGDAIFHCHFYPHFAQGMWEHWRHHDVFEAGTLLEVSGGAAAFHTAPFALGIGKPAAGARALPDGEIAAGTPIPALVPLPGRPLAPMPAPGVTVKANPNRVVPSASHATGPEPDGKVPVGSLASVPRNPDGSLAIGRNPGYPFWIAGIEDIVGQRPPTPPLDMDQGTGGFDGGLPRHAIDGYAAGGQDASTVSLIDFSKEVLRAKGVFYPEGGTDLEKLAMDFHGLTRCHNTFFPDGGAANCALTTTSTGAKLKTGGFITNGYRDADINGPGIPVQPGSPYHEPCVDDTGKRLISGTKGNFFSSALQAAAADPATKTTTVGPAAFGANKPRVYAATNLQFDVVLNKVGYHYPQQRIVSLWEDAIPVIDKKKPPEPLVMRLNTLDCAMYKHTNLVPKTYEMDDYQVRTPTDIIGQHIHLPKWDLTTTDGSANGWNYEDGTLSPGYVKEKIEAINAAEDDGFPKVAGAGSGAFSLPAGNLEAKPHPFFWGVLKDPRAACPDGPFCGARVTLQRWFADPVLNRDHKDRGLGIIFTHDHYGPSTHQQIGLYATVLTEPVGSKWAHNETGTQLGDRVKPAALIINPGNLPASRGDGGRIDGGPTSWQAQILPPGSADAFREFYFEYSDFQHAYLPGVYVGAGPDGQPLPGATPLDRVQGVAIADAFRHAVNPPARAQNTPVFPDLVLEVAGGVEPFCPERPCPQAISVQDPGVLVTNYRMEPVSDRVFDPNKIGPDGNFGTQADGLRGDLAFAFQTRTDRAIPQLNTKFGLAPPGYSAPTAPAVGKFPINQSGAIFPGDPFTPMIRAYAGDRVRVKIQAGGHEEEHGFTIHGLKWLQGGSGHGSSPTSGWRNAQAAGISEQFTFSSPVTPVLGEKGITSDHLFTAGAGIDGWWNGQWGVMRSYDFRRSDLARLPNSLVPFVIANPLDFKLLGKAVCPKTAPDRNYDVTAVLANDVLPSVPGVVIQTLGETDPLGGLAGMTFGEEVASTTSLDPGGGTLLYNPRPAVIPEVTLPEDGGGFITVGGHTGPLHDPTAILYVRTQDIDPVTGKLKAGVAPDPIVIRAAAGDCVNVTLRNRLPGDLNANGFFDDNPDLPGFATLQGVTKRRSTPEGTTTFNNNLVRPSSHVGLHPQLVAYDITRDDGTNVGVNGCPLGNCRSAFAIPETVRPGGSKIITWYAGDLAAVKSGTISILGVTINKVRLNPTPVEFGGVSLSPADRIKQGQKGLYGSLVIEPKGSNWVEDADDPLASRKIRTAATVDPTPASPNSGDEFRDFSLLLSKHLSMRWADGRPVEHLNGEGHGIPEDSQDSGQMAFNYGSEPMWFRFGVSPNAPFGAAGCGTAAPSECFGDVPNSHEAYSNALLINQGTLASNSPEEAGDPATPVFEVAPGQEARIRLTSASTTTRGTTFHLHGHVWQRAPYKVGPSGFPSQSIGDNPLSMYLGAQESITGQQHFDIRLPSAGGSNAIAGDYLFRDIAGMGNADGLWGILRVK